MAGLRLVVSRSKKKSKTAKDAEHESVRYNNKQQRSKRNMWGSHQSMMMKSNIKD